MSPEDEDEPMEASTTQVAASAKSGPKGRRGSAMKKTIAPGKPPSVSGK